MNGSRQLSHFTDSPIRFFVFDNFFSSHVYRALCNRLQDLIKRRALTRFDFKGPADSRPYDAFHAEVATTCDPLFDSIWNLSTYNFFLRAFGLPLFSNFNATFHYHLPESESGDVHNDFCAEAFQQRKLSTGLYANTNLELTKLPEHVNDLESGQVFVGARAVGLLYYLNNDDWRPEYGGETAFFSSATECTPIHKIEPINNRLLAFEVSPKSYHAFQQNHVKPRCSFTSFLYTSIANSEARFNIRPKPAHYEPADVSSKARLDQCQSGV